MRGLSGPDAADDCLTYQANKATGFCRRPPYLRETRHDHSLADSDVLYGGQRLTLYGWGKTGVAKNSWGRTAVAALPW